MPSRSSPSPSPPPAPIDVTNQAIRAVKLREIYTKAIQSTIKFNSYQNFAACFPTPATYCPTALQGVHKQLNNRLEEECIKDFEKILEERKVVQGLDEWDVILQQARQRKDRSVEGGQPEGLPAHLLPADQLAAAFTYKHLAKAVTELDAKLQATQQSNQDLVSVVQAQRQEIEQLVTGLEGLAKDVETAATALKQHDGQQLRKEVWDIEQELQAPKAASAVSKGS